MQFFFKFTRARLTGFLVVLVLPIATVWIPMVGIPASLWAMPVLLLSGLNTSEDFVVYWILGFYPVSFEGWSLLIGYYFAAAWLVSLPLNLKRKKTKR